MAKPREVVIESLADFARQVEDLLNNAIDKSLDNPLQGHWYRGVGMSGTYTLTPSLYRHPVKTNLEALIALEAKMLQDFERHSVLHTEVLPGGDANADFRLMSTCSITVSRRACLIGRPIRLSLCTSRSVRQSSRERAMRKMPPSGC
jgi:hypothetical protein